MRDRPHVACFHTISLECSRFRKIATLISIFSLFTIRWCHSLAASQPVVRELARTDRQTDGQTDRTTIYSNPRSACAPRVNNPIPTSLSTLFHSTKEHFYWNHSYYVYPVSFPQVPFLNPPSFQINIFHLFY